MLGIPVHEYLYVGDFLTDRYNVALINFQGPTPYCLDQTNEMLWVAAVKVNYQDLMVLLQCRRCSRI